MYHAATLDARMLVKIDSMHSRVQKASLTGSAKVHLRWTLWEVRATEKIKFEKSIFVGRVSRSDNEYLHDIRSRLTVAHEDTLWQTSLQTSDLLHNALHLSCRTSGLVGLRAIHKAVAAQDVLVCEIKNLKISMPGIFVYRRPRLPHGPCVDCHELAEIFNGSEEKGLVRFSIAMLEHDFRLTAKLA